MTQSPSAPKKGGPGGMSPRLIAALVLAALAVIFVLQNTGRGRVSFLFWHIDAPA